MYLQAKKEPQPIRNACFPLEWKARYFKQVNRYELITTTVKGYFRKWHMLFFSMNVEGMTKIDLGK